MGFESGSISFRVFSMPRPMPEDAIERFAELSIPPLETISESALYGWVTGRHMFDTDIREETAIYAGWLRMALLQLEKKVPASLMQAEMKREELVRCTADDKPFINRRERTEIKEELMARLLPSMPPSLKGYPLVGRPDGTRLFAAALADKQADILVLHLRHALGIAPLPLTLLQRPLIANRSTPGLGALRVSRRTCRRKKCIMSRAQTF